MIGIETEYGIYVEGKGAQDLVAESTALVQAYPAPVAMGWDYRQEHPRRDMRGFTAEHLSIDPTDAQFEQSNRPHSTDVEVRSDRMLPSGARLYNDHGHPEFSTPECGSLHDLVVQDRAGEHVMFTCARQRQTRMGGGLVALYKNNTDFHGASYGTHESYLTRREVPFDAILSAMLPFLTTRQIFAGAGKVGVEQQNSAGTGASGALFQLSARADFFTTLASVDTLYNRPIVNTRDEPHSDPRKFRRFHVICGDANFCEIATFLKAGTTLLILRLLEKGWRPEGVALRDPVSAIKQISRDQSFRWLAERQGGGTIGSVDIQRVYLAGAKEHLGGLSGETDLVLSEWEATLDALESDPLSLNGTLDWVTKRQLLDGFRDSEGMQWDDPTLQSLDLEYHNVDPEAGLYLGLEQDGQVRRLTTDDEIARAVASPPHSSPRAIVRGLAVQKFAPQMSGVTWSRFMLADTAGQTASVRLSRVDDLDPIQLLSTLSATKDAATFLSSLEQLEREAGTDTIDDDGST